MSYFTWAFGIWTTAVVVVSFKTYSFSGKCANKHESKEQGQHIHMFLKLFEIQSSPAALEDKSDVKTKKTKFVKRRKSLCNDHFFNSL